MKVVRSAVYIGLIAAFALLAGSVPGRAGSAGEINAGVNATLDRMYRLIPGTRALAAKAAGILVFPTNYLVRFDVGIDRQDMLLPSMNVSLGFSSAATTHASYEAPVQMVLLGRRQTVEVAGRKLVDAGRLVEALVEGIDPFR